MAGRGQWNSRFGFIMAAVGSAVGLGNLVRFPREMADQGGAAFLFVYLGLLLIVGLPAMLGEMSLGKMSGTSPVNAYRQLAGDVKSRWAALGMFGVLAALFVLFFYTVIAGWALRFFVESFRDGWFDDPSGLFDTVSTGPWTIFWNFVVTGVTVYIVSRGISGGIEKATVIMMPALFLIIVGIVIYALFQPGMGAGYREIFDPDFGELSVNNVSNAIGQVFFSLSLGQGAILTYASYMEKKQSVAKDGTTIAFADSGVAILAAMMIFPVLAFTGLLMDPVTQAQLDSGSFGTAFRALPNAFVSMGDVIGRIVGAVFFLGLFFAALSSSISLLEVPVSVLVDGKGLARWKAALLMGMVTYSFGVLSSINGNWLDLFDQIAINVFIVVGVALTTIFAGWKAKGVAKELDAGLKSRIGVYVVWMMRTVTPVLILVTFIFGGLWGTNANGDFAFWYLAGEDGGTSANWRNLLDLFGRAFRFE